MNAPVAAEESFESLQRQIDELRAERGPEASFGGQYRINSYSADNDLPTEDNNQAANRLRIRQNIDLRLSEQFDTHLQLELGHTTGNIGTTGRGTLSDQDNPGTGEVRVRHGVMRYRADSDTVLRAGIIPLSDRFGDALFSGDWDYNPLAAAADIPLTNGSLRLVAGSLSEGSETLRDDDANHYQADFSFTAGAAELTLSGVLLRMPDDFTGSPGGNYNHANYGLALSYPLHHWQLDAFVLASSTDKELLGTTEDGSGVALKTALSGPLGIGRLGVMVTYASGEGDGSGFLPTMALPGTYGYWGYTGVLTVQGPTDTGIDGDAVNISNNGYGMTTVQARYSFPIMPDLDGYVAAGWFGNTDAAGRSGSVGTDLLMMATYHFNKVLALDFGLAAAALEDSVSGYWRGAAGRRAGDGAFNQAAGEDRDKRLAFTRIQAEF
ncbi:hypothetical protein D0851_14370 [Marinobacter sp. Arc7-DN-1]|nr:hypothetical protein D0851_14370 [Marinobacter sp. Arc7-DN-1]